MLVLVIICLVRIGANVSKAYVGLMLFVFSLFSNLSPWIDCEHVWLWGNHSQHNVAWEVSVGHESNKISYWSSLLSSMYSCGRGWRCRSPETACAGNGVYQESSIEPWQYHTIIRLVPIIPRLRLDAETGGKTRNKNIFLPLLRDQPSYPVDFAKSWRSKPYLLNVIMIFANERIVPRMITTC